jgi:hypothetical protein
MRLLGFSILSLCAAAVMAQAGAINVSLDTSLLIGDSSGPFSIGFELADGSGTGDGNNAVAISNFLFGSGGATGAPSTFGSAGGDLSSSVLLTDLSVFNVFTQTFLPGSALSFTVNFTNNIDSGSPDEFIFAILDNTQTPIPTTGGIALLEIDFDSASPTVQTFAGDPTQYMGTGEPGIALPDPVLTPEPSTFGLGAFSLAALAGALWRRRLSDSPANS